MQRKERTSKRETQGRQSTQHNEINFQLSNGDGMRNERAGEKFLHPEKQTVRFFATQDRCTTERLKEQQEKESAY